jgi:hypothetical protein
VIHELLHSLGLGENPPSSDHIPRACVPGAASPGWHHEHLRSEEPRRARVGFPPSRRRARLSVRPSPQEAVAVGDDRRNGLLLPCAPQAGASSGRRVAVIDIGSKNGAELIGRARRELGLDHGSRGPRQHRGNARGATARPLRGSRSARLRFVGPRVASSPTR